MSTTASTTATSSRATNSTVSIPATAPAGLLTITQPPETTVAFYKIAPSQFITFAWNFSYVLSTPSHLTVSAICENGNTYPVGPTNGVIPGSATSVVWDVYGWDQSNPNSPLAQATYTLEIFDERGPDSSRSPGLLQPNSGLKFALYTPQSYTPIASGNFFLVRFQPHGLTPRQVGNAPVAIVVLSQQRTLLFSASALPFSSCSLLDLQSSATLLVRQTIPMAWTFFVLISPCGLL